MRSFCVYVPASTSNIGPGFDCVGLAVNLWNEARFYLIPRCHRSKLQRKATKAKSKNNRVKI